MVVMERRAAPALMQAGPGGAPGAGGKQLPAGFLDPASVPGPNGGDLGCSGPIPSNGANGTPTNYWVAGGGGAGGISHSNGGPMVTGGIGGRQPGGGSQNNGGGPGWRMLLMVILERTCT